MRIAVFTDAFHPEVGGIAQSLLASGATLARRGHAVLYAIPGGERFAGAVSVPEDGALGGEVSVLRLPAVPGGKGAGHGRVVVPTGLGALRCRAWAPDVIHANGPFGAGLEALAAARLLRVPLVGTHRAPTEDLVRGTPRSYARLTAAVRGYVRWYYNRCDLVTAPLENLITAMRRDGLRSPVRLVADALLAASEPGTAGRIEPKRRLGLPGFTLLHVGRLAPDDRVDGIIRAIPSLVARIPGVSLMLVGRGRAESSLRTLADALQVTSHVRFLGHLPPARRREAYAASDAFVATGADELQRTAATEAMASALPVIAIRVPGMAEYVDASHGILVEPNDAATLAEAILALHRDPARTAALGAAGSAHAARFNPELIATEWEAIYGELLSLSRRLVAVPAGTRPSTAPKR